MTATHFSLEGSTSYIHILLLIAPSLGFPYFLSSVCRPFCHFVFFYSPFIMCTVPWAPDSIITIFSSILLILPSLLYLSATLFSSYFLSFLSCSKGNLFRNFIFPSLASLVNLNCASVIQKVTCTICLPFFFLELLSFGKYL